MQLDPLARLYPFFGNAQADAETTELGSDITDESSKDTLQKFRKTGLTLAAIARAVLYAVSQPDDVDVNEVIVRPTASLTNL